jgi:hypothetical protein
MHSQTVFYMGTVILYYLAGTKARESGIDLNALVARSNGVQIDMFRYWTISSDNTLRLYTKFNSDGTFMHWYRMFSAFPASWLLLSDILFLGDLASGYLISGSVSF